MTGDIYIYIYFFFFGNGLIDDVIIIGWTDSDLKISRALLMTMTLRSRSQTWDLNVKASVNVFKTSLFPNPIIDLIHLWYDDTYWSKNLCSTIPTTLGHVKVKVTDLEFSC